MKLPIETYDSEPPPILGSWRNVYITVIAWLAFLVPMLLLVAWPSGPARKPREAAPAPAVVGQSAQQ